MPYLFACGGREFILKRLFWKRANRTMFIRSVYSWSIIPVGNDVPRPESVLGEAKLFHSLCQFYAYDHLFKWKDHFTRSKSSTKISLPLYECPACLTATVILL